MSRVIDDVTGTMAKASISKAEADVFAELEAQKLLEGWTLSAQTCRQTPDCMMPLLMKDAFIYCGRCDAAGESTEAAADSESSSTSALSVSTPPTPSLNLAAADEAPAPRLSEVARDAAATEIGNLLCKGWCLLGEYCPQCPGIPLMARPRSRPEPSGSGAPVVQGGRPPGRVCVNCRSEFLPSQQAETLAPNGGAAVRKRARLSEEQQASKRDAPASSVAPSGLAASVGASSMTDVAPLTIRSLENALAVLSRQLDVASRGEPLNVGTMGELAEAIGKTAHSLSLVRAL